VGEPARTDDFDTLWERLSDVPEGYVGEIVRGEIQTHPSPNAPHAVAASRLGALLSGPFDFGTNGPGGWILIDEPRIRFGDEMRIPDLGGWRVERYQPLEEGPFTVMPDWVCEVLSRSTAKEDRTQKMPLYARYGIPCMWVLDPTARTVEVYRLQSEHWLLLDTFGEDDRIRAEPFAEVELDLSLLWQPSPSG